MWFQQLPVQIPKYVKPSLIVGLVVALCFGSFVGVLASASSNYSQRLDDARDLVLARHPDEAMKEIRKILADLGEEHSETHKKALLKAAQITDIHMDDSHVMESLAFYRTLIAQYPASQEAFDASVRIAEILQQRAHDETGAQHQYLATVHAFSSHVDAPTVLLKAARIAIDLRHFDDAQTYLNEYQKSYAEASSAAEALTMQGTVLHLQGKIREAVEVFSSVSHRFPQTDHAALALVEAGDCLSELGDFSQAMGKYIEALSSHPNPQLVQHSLERTRRKFLAQRANAPSVTAKSSRAQAWLEAQK